MLYDNDYQIIPHVLTTVDNCSTSFPGICASPNHLSLRSHVSDEGGIWKYTHQQLARSFYFFIILTESSSQVWLSPRQRSRDGKISTIPFATVTKPDLLGVSGVRQTSKHKRAHLGSERSFWNRGPSKISSTSSYVRGVGVDLQSRLMGL